jgi:hypothetical protein
VSRRPSVSAWLLSLGAFAGRRGGLHACELAAEAVRSACASGCMQAAGAELPEQRRV